MVVKILVKIVVESGGGQILDVKWMRGAWPRPRVGRDIGPAPVVKQ